MTSDGLDGLVLDFGLSFKDLHHRDGLTHLDDCWLDCLNTANPGLGRRYTDARRGPDAIDSRAEAAMLIEVSAHVDAFIARLFGIAESFELLRAAHTRLDPLYRVKWKFVKRQALLGVPAQALVGFDADAARAMLVEAISRESADRDGSVGDHGQDPSLQTNDFDELAFAQAVLRWQADASVHADRLEIARLYSAWAVTTDEGHKRHGHGVLFRHPSHIDPLDLLRHTVCHEHDGVSITTIRPDQIRRRLDHDRAPFALTDAGTGLAGALDESHYCLLCHKQGTDSCSTGLRQTPSGEGTAPFRRDAFGNALSGCPLEERISEFHTLKRSGLAISALAMMMIDNPMVAATGHRICNDCMKACIYQAQTPVDIPQAETRTLKDVLELPWGLEIYSLLSRWNPLNLRRPLPAPASGRKVLVVGTGPAGFTLAHYLMNDGHTVVAIDGLKIEPLAQSLSGVDPHGARGEFAPVRDINSLHEDLDSRTISGFGGVAEYGITVRWDKNFLKIVRLLLERRDQFTLIGGVRFGGTLGVDDAWQLGFDHIALAIGAGKPTTLDIPNGLARGVRTASDFLMALQLTGAAQADSIANMQLRLPAVVIGGGLTAIDTATEALAYYVSQVDKFLARHEALVADIGPAAARAGWRADEHTLADEFIAHARALRAERDEARKQARPARLVELLQSWGGVTVCYRRRLIDSPAYTLNHEELNRALEEGLRFAECLAPRRIDVDADSAVRSITFSRQHRDAQGQWQDGGDIELPARTVIIAAGNGAFGPNRPPL
ncbi:MAG: FAD-dependent oxidoreductase, partial [Burkholderiales bacterium]